MRGKLNGLGGKQRDDEGKASAMTREFVEETGANVPYYQWDHYVTFYGSWGKVRCFRVSPVGALSMTIKSYPPVR